MNQATTGRRRGMSVVGIVLTALLAILAWEKLARPPQADAQTNPLDAVQDRRATIEELKKLNTKMDQLQELLKSGSVKVTVTEDAPAKPAAPGRIQVR